VRLLLLESAVLSAIGGAAGLLVASWGLDALLATMPEPPPHWAQMGIDGRVLGFTAAVSALTALACGLLPALRLTRFDASHVSLHAARSGGQSRDQRRLQGSLVVTQVAVSLALLVCATLLARSVMQLQYADAGFDPRPLLSLRVSRGQATTTTRAPARAGARRITDHIAPCPPWCHRRDQRHSGDDGGVRPARLIAAAVRGKSGHRRCRSRGVLRGDRRALAAGAPSPTLKATRPMPTSSSSTARSRHAGRGGTVGRQLRVAGGIRRGGVSRGRRHRTGVRGSATAQSGSTCSRKAGGWRTMGLLLRVSGIPTVAPSVRQGDAMSIGRCGVRSADDDGTPTRDELGRRFIGNTFALFAVAALLLACVGAYAHRVFSGAAGPGGRRSDGGRRGPRRFCAC
jgi:hypothetical protein